MHSSGSFLRTVIERIRTYLDEPDVDAKFTDDYIVRHVICPGMVDVISRINNTTTAPIILEATLTMDGEETRFVLPPCIAQVHRFVVQNDAGDPILDVLPRDIYNRLGVGWRLEGSPSSFVIVVPSPPAGTNTIKVWYTSNGDILPHLASGTLAEDADTLLNTVTLATTPTLGSVDRREGAYIGQYLRILTSGDTNPPIEERPIVSHDRVGSSWKVVVDPPFEHASVGTITYEIVPCGAQSMMEATAAWCASKLGTARKISNEHMSRILTNYRASLKTIGDNLTTAQARMPHTYPRDTIDSPQNQSPFTWSPIR